MGRRDPVAVAVKQHAGEQARLANAYGGVTFDGVAGELRLNRFPQPRINDRRVFAGMGVAFVNDLAAIEAAFAAQAEAAPADDLAPAQAGPRPRPGRAPESP